MNRQFSLFDQRVESTDVFTPTLTPSRWIRYDKAEKLVKIPINGISDVYDFKERIAAVTKFQDAAYTLIVQYPEGTALDSQLILEECEGGISPDQPIIVTLPFGKENNVLLHNSINIHVNSIQIGLFGSETS